MIKNILILLGMAVVGAVISYSVLTQVNSIEDMHLGQSLTVVTEDLRALEVKGCNMSIETLGVKIPVLIAPIVIPTPQGIVCGPITCKDESSNRKFECLPADFFIKTQKQKKEERR